MVPAEFQQYPMVWVTPDRGGCHETAFHLACPDVRFGFGKGEDTLMGTLKYKLPARGRSETCDGYHCPVLVLRKLPSPEGDTVVVTFLPKSTGFGALITCHGDALAPFNSYIGRGCCGPRCSSWLPHVQPGFQPSSFPNPMEGCTVIKNIYTACMGMCICQKEPKRHLL